MEVSAIENKVKMDNSILRIIKGVVISIISTIILLFIFSAVLTYTSFSEAYISPVIIILTGISIFIGSTICTSKIRKNGLLNGGLVGGIYLSLIYILSSTINMNFSLNLEAILIILTGTFCGMIGGIIGVNKSKK